MSEVKGKYFTTSEYNKFTSKILDAKVKKKKELINRSKVSTLIKSSDLNTKLATFARKTELKAEQI